MSGRCSTSSGTDRRQPLRATAALALALSIAASPATGQNPIVPAYGFERSGSLVYAANPSGQEPAEFVSTTLTDSMVVFENLGHDFPQRVIYRRAGSDSLNASVEGTARGKQRTVSFPYARTPCVTGGPATQDR